MPGSQKVRVLADNGTIDLIPARPLPGDVYIRGERTKIVGNNGPEGIAVHNCYRRGAGFLPMVDRPKRSGSERARIHNWLARLPSGIQRLTVVAVWRCSLPDS